MANTEHCLRLIPSRFEGLPAVREIAIFPDRLELLAANQCKVVRFLDIALWHRCGWIWRPLARLGWVRGYPEVADRDWFHPPSGRYFQFYTEPPITVYLPDEPAGVSFGNTIFRRVQEMIAAGGYSTYDLG